jgi:hypothetical protein
MINKQDMPNTKEELIAVVISGLLAFAASLSRSIHRGLSLVQAAKRAGVAFFLGGAAAALLHHFFPNLSTVAVGGVCALVGVASDVVVIGVDQVFDAAIRMAVRYFDKKERKEKA